MPGEDIVDTPIQEGAPNDATAEEIRRGIHTLH